VFAAPEPVSGPINSRTMATPPEQSSQRAQISVLVIVEDADGLVETVRSLDLQTLPRSQYDVHVLLATTDTHLADRLRSLEKRRPNVVFVDASAGLGAAVSSTLDGLDDVLVLPLAAGTLLHAEALERLAGAATGGAVAGRRSGDGAVLPASTARPLTTPLTFLAAPLPEARAAAGAATSAPVPEWLSTWQQAVLAQEQPVTELLDYPAVRGQEVVTLGQADVREPELSWQGTRLHLRVGVAAHGLGTPTDATFFLHHVGLGLEYLVDAQVTLEGSELLLTGSFDPSDAALGSELPGGEWLVAFEVASGADVLRALVPNSRITPAIINGRPVMRTIQRDELGLQVDRARRSLVDADPDSAEITESVAGTRMVLPLRNLYLGGTPVVTGTIVLGRLPVRADIRDTPDGPVLEAWLSGLVGSYPIGVKFGGAPVRSTGLVLEVDGIGGMRVAKAKTKPAGPNAGPGADPTPATIVDRLRAAVPDPVAKALGRRGGRA
jgi:hypothetical protein